MLMRFTQADTIVPDPGDPQALNRYSYVVNNPLRYTDPTGREYGTDGLLCLLGCGNPPRSGYTPPPASPPGPEPPAHEHAPAPQPVEPDPSDYEDSYEGNLAYGDAQKEWQDWAVETWYSCDEKHHHSSCDSNANLFDGLVAILKFPATDCGRALQRIIQGSVEFAPVVVGAVVFVAAAPEVGLAVAATEAATAGTGTAAGMGLSMERVFYEGPRHFGQGVRWAAEDC